MQNILVYLAFLKRRVFLNCLLLEIFYKNRNNTIVSMKIIRLIWKKYLIHSFGIYYKSGIPDASRNSLHR